MTIDTIATRPSSQPEAGTPVTRPLYQVLAKLVQDRLNYIAYGDEPDKEGRIEIISNMLCSKYIDTEGLVILRLDFSNKEMLLFRVSAEKAVYTVYVTPSLMNGFYVNVQGWRDTDEKLRIRKVFEAALAKPIQL